MQFSKRIIVGGLPRSGSTLLRFVLGSLPGAIGCPETSFFLQPLSLSQARIAGTIRNVQRALDLDADLIRAAVMDSSCEIDAFDRLMRAYAQSMNENPVMWIEKSPWNCRSYQLLGTTKKEVRFLSIIRDGRDVVTSYHYSGKHYHCSVQRYVDVMRLILSFVDDRHMIVRYEDFVSDPHATLQAICSHCGAAFDPAALQRWREPHPSRSHQKVNQPKLVNDISSEWVERWRMPEHSQRIREFEAHPDATRLLKASGY